MDILRPYILPMYLRAISQGYAVPEADFDAVVHSVFQSALNLRLSDDDLLLTLIVSSEGDLPQGIGLDVPDGFSFTDFRLGELAICRDGILRFEKSSLIVPLYQARRWTCDLPALKFDPGHPAVSTAWRFVWDALNARQRCSKTEIVADELLTESTLGGVSRKAGEAIRDLLNATRTYDSNPSAIEALIGLGSGLTPSGDDFLVGYLAGLWCTRQDESKRTLFVSNLGKTIIRLSARTNDISRTYLYHAAQGQVSSRLADLVEAICRDKNTERLNEVAEAAFKVGHSSGMDAATGLLIGLAAWSHQPLLPSPGIS
jgi:hypothetical protein